MWLNCGEDERARLEAGQSDGADHDASTHGSEIGDASSVGDVREEKPKPVQPEKEVALQGKSTKLQVAHAEL